jgi:hypothetical protein
MRLITFFFFLGVLVLTPQAHSQVTITNASVPAVNTFVVERFLDSVSAVRLNIGSAGGNQTWNFASVGILSAINNDTTYFIAASRTPCTRQFPNAQLATGSATEYTYYSTNNNTLSIVGSCSATDSSRYTPPQIFLRTPFAMGNTVNDTARIVTYDAANGNDTAIFRQNLTADAWGTITTPGGSFSALRIARTFSFDVNIFGIPATVVSRSMEWWADGRPVPVFSHTRTILYTPLGNDTTYDGSFMQRFTVNTSDPVATFNSIEKVYPNPAFNDVAITFDLKEAVDVRFEVVNLMGQVALSTAFEAWTVGKNTKNIALENVPSGAYLLRMVNREGQTIGIQKFNVLK